MADQQGSTPTPPPKPPSPPATPAATSDKGPKQTNAGERS